MIELGDGVIPLKVKCSQSYHSYSPAFLLVDNNGNKEIWSAGKDDSGLLGLGKDVTVNKDGKFNCLHYSKELVKFEDIDSYGISAYALTTDGTVYGWGKLPFNEDNNLIDNQNFWSPTEIKCLRPYIVSKISAGVSHLVAIASPQSHPDMKQVL